jgi:hypothetical protein
LDSDVRDDESVENVIAGAHRCAADLNWRIRDDAELESIVAAIDALLVSWDEGELAELEDASNTAWLEIPEFEESLRRGLHSIGDDLRSFLAHPERRGRPATGR